jgi:hypothetical protein
MKPTHNLLTTLEKELDFIDHAGYRKPIGSRQPLFCMETSVEWRKPAFFEDSPSCPKEHYCACDPKRGCILLGFVPRERRSETVPCHHIPLNEQGDTIASFEKSGQHEQVEPALRNWLVKTIGKLRNARAQ